ncbi:MAG TPA: hypothetical protein VF884_00020 [Nitrososphaeraceae archaeon]
MFIKTKTFGIAGIVVAAIAILMTTSPLFIADSAFADSGHGHHYGHHHHYKHHHHDNDD